MPFPVIGAIAIGVGIGSRIVGNRARKNAERKRAEALKGNALVQLANTLSGLNARQREELASARQEKRLGRRQSRVLEARAIAGGAESGTGASEQVQDIGLGESEFLSSIDTQLDLVTSELSRRRRGANREFQASLKAADAGISGGAQDFLDFANTLAFGLNAFDALPRSRSSASDVPAGGN